MTGTVKLTSAGGGSVSMVTPSTGSNRTVTLPDADITIPNALPGATEGYSKNVLSAQGDILYASGANTLARLAKGTAGKVLKMNSGATAPEWGSGAEVSVTAETAWTTLGTGNDVTITGIAAGAKRLTLLVRHASFTGSNEFEVEIGDAGGIETSGYVHASWYLGSSQDGTQPVTDCFQTYNINSTSVAMGHRYDFRRWDDGTHEWMMEGLIVYNTGTSGVTFGMTGFKTLSAELTQIRLGAHASDTFDSGEYKLFTWT